MTSSEQREAAPRGLERVLPIVQWVGAYERDWLRSDLVAGLAVTALVVPKALGALGYAEIAEGPVRHGLYAAAAGDVYALFGTSRQISTGPSSALSAVAGSAVMLSGVAGDDAARLVGGMTLVGAALSVALGGTVIPDWLAFVSGVVAATSG